MSFNIMALSYVCLFLYAKAAVGFMPACMSCFKSVRSPAFQNTCNRQRTERQFFHRWVYGVKIPRLPSLRISPLSNESAPSCIWGRRPALTRQCSSGDSNKYPLASPKGPKRPSQFRELETSKIESPTQVKMTISIQMTFCGPKVKEMTGPENDMSL